MVAGDAENCWVLDDTFSAKEGLELLRPMTQNGALAHLHCARDSGPGESGHTLPCEGLVEASVVT